MVELRKAWNPALPLPGSPTAWCNSDSLLQIYLENRFVEGLTPKAHGGSHTSPPQVILEVEQRWLPSRRGRDRSLGRKDLSFSSQHEFHNAVLSTPNAHRWKFIFIIQTYWPGSKFMLGYYLSSKGSPIFRVTCNVRRQLSLKAFKLNLIEWFLHRHRSFYVNYQRASSSGLYLSFNYHNWNITIRTLL